MKPAVEFDCVSFRYGVEPVLVDIDLHLHPGQFAALVGPSGAGKTTLLKILLGLLAPTEGQVRVATNHGGEERRGKARPRIGYVPQLETVDWNFPLTVAQMVLLGRTQQSGVWPWPTREDRRRLALVLDSLEIGELAQRHIRDLSGGQQQRAFLARALIAEPDLLVLDEPTSGVDMRTAENLLRRLADLNRRGMTILITTHDLNAAAAHLPWVVCLNRRIIAQGTPETVFTEAILNETYQGEMLVFRQDGMILVQQKPHGHTHRDVVPNPVPGEIPLKRTAR